MAGVYVAEDCMTEDTLGEIMDGVELSEAQKEALKKFYGLPCDEHFVASLGAWRGYAAAAWGKIRMAKGDPRQL